MRLRIYLDELTPQEYASVGVDLERTREDSL
jgi:hypothetical protein